MGSEQITRWLHEGDLPCQEIRPNRWTIELSHQLCNYVVTITDHGNWFSFAADLMGDVADSQKEDFYNFVLELNGRLNGVHIALEGGRFILIHDDYSGDVDKYTLYRSLNIFHEAHEYVYGKMLEEADALGVFLYQ